MIKSYNQNIWKKPCARQTLKHNLRHNSMTKWQLREEKPVSLFYKNIPDTP